MRVARLQQRFPQGVEWVIHFLEMWFLKTLQQMGERRALRFARFVAPLFTLPYDGQRYRNWDCFCSNGSWTKADRKKLQVAYYDYLARMYAEQAYFSSAPPEQLLERVAVSGLTHMDEALRLGRGVMVVGGHVGSYRFIPAVLGLRGYDVTTFVRSARLPGNEAYFRHLTDRYNCRVVFTYENVLKALREVSERNGVIYVVFDSFPLDRSPAWLPFGPGRMRLSRGPAVLACRHRLPVVYAVAPQEESGRSSVFFRPVESAADPNQLVGVWLQHLYADIKRFPAQWWEWPFQTIRDNEHIRYHALKEELAQ